MRYFDSQHRTVIGLASTLLLAIGAASPAPACSPGVPLPGFWYKYSPDDQESFLAGELGVLGPELSKPFLYVAYRHLMGPGLDKTSSAGVTEFWRAPEADPWSYNAVKLWTDAVRQVTGRRRSSGYWQAQVPLARPDGKYAGFFINCLEDAFRTAAETLHARADGWSVSSYGPGSEELTAWVDAQDIVFGNCGANAGSVPAPLGASASRLARADRAYQIAAAYFYSRDYDTAAEHFGEIAADRSSPWSDLAAYLVARCHLRSSTVGFRPRNEQFTRAREVLDAVIADPSRAAVHDMSLGLHQYIDIRLDPLGTRDRLRRRLMAVNLEPALRQDLIDYFWLLDRVPSERIEEQIGLDRWMLLFRWRRAPDAGSRAFRIWQAESLGSPILASDISTAENGVEAGGPEAWLAASLMLATGSEPWIDIAMERALKMTPDSRLFFTVRFHLARLQKQSGDYEAARAGLAEVLDALDSRVSPGDRNRFRLLMAEMAPTLDQRIELGQLMPLSYIWDHEGRGDHPLAMGSPYMQRFAGHQLPADVAVDALNLSSTERIERLCRSQDLP